MDNNFYPPQQLRLLAEAAKTAEQSLPDSAAFCEIGVYQGNSASVLAHYRGNHELWLIDNLSLEGASRAEWPSGNGVVHCASVDDAWPLTRLSLLHDDSAHTFAATLAHLQRLGQMVVVGGLIALHDFHDDYPDVERAWLAWDRRADFEPWGSEDRLAIFIRRR